MKIKCEYCDSMINDSMEKCPFCGATNENVVRSTPDQPTTIEGLKQWYRDRGLPPYDVTRFFIGENHIGAKAFGIYADGDNFIVYKNKADGSRAIRYKGTDEAYAVNELLQRLKQEIIEQKVHNISNARNSNTSTSGYESSRSNGRKSGYGKFLLKYVFILMTIQFAISLVVLFVTFWSGHSNLAKDGYYRYNNHVYYHDSYKSEEAWYTFDDYSDKWTRVYDNKLPSALADEDRREDFYFTPVWDKTTQYTDFETSSTAVSSHNSLEAEYNRNHVTSDSWSSSDDSSSYDWDSGSSSWDSDSSSWDSDW